MKHVYVQPNMMNMNQSNWVKLDSSLVYEVKKTFFFSFSILSRHTLRESTRHRTIRRTSEMEETDLAKLDIHRVWDLSKHSDNGDWK